MRAVVLDEPGPANALVVREAVGRRYRLDEIAQAHRDLEANLIAGKGVVVT